MVELRGALSHLNTIYKSKLRRLRRVVKSLILVMVVSDEYV